jgi:hypothetical protein
MMRSVAANSHSRVDQGPACNTGVRLPLALCAPSKPHAAECGGQGVKGFTAGAGCVVWSVHVLALEITASPRELNAEFQCRNQEGGGGRGGTHVRTAAMSRCCVLFSKYSSARSLWED